MSDPPVSAARLADLLGELPGPESVTPEEIALVERVRELVEAVVLTDADRATLTDAAGAVAALTQRLAARRRDGGIRLIRHADGRLENLTQAGSGRLNPQAPPLEFVDLPPDPPRGAEPRPVEIRARCTLTAAHGGSPDRVHGGVVALLLDQVLGMAVHAAGAGGLTRALTVELRKATPFGVPLEITARCTEFGGGRSRATGELRHGEVVTAEAVATFVTDRTK
ncbi:MAG: aromatic compounds degradation protein paaI [Acidimicrobiales bacterium]|jgi:acyl-coenzyme A thioesterase PaaI-like protein|nr:aromatic compounds degradation protein paaI [Acidimicrobiales bacterium]